MKKQIVLLLLLGAACTSWAQGPPITADKPIMLGGGYIIKTLTEVRSTEGGTFTRFPLMVHYLPSANSLVALHAPLVFHNFKTEGDFEDGMNLGDLQLLGKYQFYRKDGHAKTFRMVLKTIQSLPTGKEYGITGMSTGQYESYVGVVAGRETIKLGMSWEAGYNWSPSSDRDELRLRYGIGLPILRPVYPVKQVNIYFELSGNILTERNQSEWLYAQGLQYAIKRLTFEAAYQWPISTSVDDLFQFKSSVFLGARYII
ncbi:MAG: hypothetical protein KTR24_12090 [Saprospiraceae bacterium]|nr:hypothetical protein [Saprospiraceae bacterium]